MPILSTPPTKTEIKSLIDTYLVHSGGITAEEHKEIETALLDVLFTDRSLLGDIKEVACTDAYISTNFETSGTNIGRGKVGTERYGWAICNGYNGTIDKRGNVSIGYDPVSYPTLATLGVQGNQGGEKTHTLTVQEIPPHLHHIKGSNSDNGDPGTAVLTQAVSQQPNLGVDTENTGGGQSHNNMQPYIVTLFIQKISTPY